jgi:hypothetical protein
MRHGELIAAVGLLALLGTAPALAQTQSAAGDMGNNSGGIGVPALSLGGAAEVDEATAEKRREIEAAYKRATKSQPAQAAASNDPWANMRGDEAKPAAKPAARTAQKKKPAQ